MSVSTPDSDANSDSGSGHGFEARAWELREQVRPGEIVAWPAPPPAAPGQVARRCRAAAPELLVVDAGGPDALADLDELSSMPRSRRVRLGLSVVVVTDDLRAVANLVDRVLATGEPFLPTERQPGEPLLLADIDDDIAYFGVLDDARWERREEPRTRAHILR